MMLLCLKVLVILSLLGLAAANDVQDFLGRSVYIPSQDLRGSLAGGAFYSNPVLRNIISSCFHVTPLHQSSRYFAAYKDTASYYSSITTTTGLSTSLQADFSLGVTLDIQSKGISGSDKTVSGNDLLIVAKSKSFALDGSCLNLSAFTDGFLQDLSKLPTVVPSPWLKSSWQIYDTFLKKYGTHVMAEITTGSEIRQSAFASTSSSYSQRDFEVKSCIGLAGLTPVGMLNVNMCANISHEEITKVTSMKMSTTTTANGGTAATRNEILKHRTSELIEQFMNEANETDAPISYKFIAVWDLIKQNLIGVSADFIRGVNLEAFYLGYLNYGCPFSTSEGQNLQKFDITDTSTPENPVYECTLTPEGCHSDDDCHYHPVWCACQGNSCVNYRATTLDTGKIKTTAYINRDEALGWHGCNWKYWGFVCSCYNDRIERVKVWPDNVNQMYTLYKAHNSMMEMRKKMEILAESTKTLKNREDL